MAREFSRSAFLSASASTASALLVGCSAGGISIPRTPTATDALGGFSIVGDLAQREATVLDASRRAIWTGQFSEGAVLTMTTAAATRSADVTKFNTLGVAYSLPSGRGTFSLVSSSLGKIQYDDGRGATIVRLDGGRLRMFGSAVEQDITLSETLAGMSRSRTPQDLGACVQSDFLVVAAMVAFDAAVTAGAALCGSVVGCALGVGVVALAAYALADAVANSVGACAL